MAAHAPVDNTRHGLSYTVGGNQAARTASLTDDGPLLARAASWWAAALGHALINSANGDVEVPVDVYQFVTGESFDMAAALRGYNLTWHPALPAVAWPN